MSSQYRYANQQQPPYRPSRTPSPNPSGSAKNSGVAPRLPPKDHQGSLSASASRSGSSTYNTSSTPDYLSIPPSTSSFSNNLSRYAHPSSAETDDLAQAVRDSVQIRSPSPSSTNLARPLDPTPSATSRRSPSPRMPQANMPSVNFAASAAAGQQLDFSAPQGMGKGWEPGHAYSHSSPDMGHSLPRSSSGPGMNPFDEEGESQAAQPARLAKQHRSPEGAGMIAPSRQKFSRAMTATTPSSASQTPLLATSPDAPAPVPKARVRRSLSTDSYGVDTGPMRELTAGQKKAAAEKKGSKHADIIDRWDPTGLGDAMWHHSGPYDAAAPSRNIGNTKAPMQVFAKSTTPATGAGTTTTAATAAPGRKTTTIQESEHTAAATSAAAPIPAASARQPINRRVSGGGLTGQYSTSIPTGGGYFPDHQKPQDEASLARMEREREKEMKQRALKAAWGIDEPEPWEDFGVSPDATTGTLANDGLAPDTTYAKPLRSPGLRLGNSRGDSFSTDSSGLPSPTSENMPISTAELPGSAAAGRPGVKRTKSLMQKFKTMVRTRSGSVAAAAEEQNPVPVVGARYRDRTPRGDRSQSMSAGAGVGQGGWGASPSRPTGYDRGLVEEEEVVDEVDERFRDAEEEEDVYAGSRVMREGVGRVVQAGPDRRRY